MAAKLRHIPTGDIYIYQPQLAARPDMEEFIEGEVVEAKVEEVAKPKRRRRPAAPAAAEEVQVEVEDAPEADTTEGE